MKSRNFNQNRESAESTVNTISNSMSQCCGEKLNFNACRRSSECAKSAKVQSDRAGSSETRSRGCRQALTGSPGSDPRQPYSERRLHGNLTFSHPDLQAFSVPATHANLLSGDAAHTISAGFPDSRMLDVRRQIADVRLQIGPRRVMRNI